MEDGNIYKYCICILACETCINFLVTFCTYQIYKVAYVARLKFKKGIGITLKAVHVRSSKLTWQVNGGKQMLWLLAINST